MEQADDVLKCFASLNVYDEGATWCEEGHWIANVKCEGKGQDISDCRRLYFRNLRLHFCIHHGTK